MVEENKKSLPVDVSEITQFVKPIFNIESMMTGGKKEGYRVRYSGKLTASNSEKAYDQLAQAMKDFGLTPLFREKDGQHEIILVDELPSSEPGPIWVNILLFFLTILSVMFTGAQFTDTEITQPFQLSFTGFIQYVLQGWPFALSLLGILLAHELGHYLVGRSRGEKVTLPYFIPLPLSAFGTMGAFISMKEIPKNKKHLMDIGVAGPLIG